jgi:hypothetical protein
MKLKHLSRIETTIRFILTVIALPFAIICHIFDMIKYPFNWVVEEIAIFSKWIGNKLLRCSDEVKDGTIKNQDFIKKYTASFTWKLLNKKQI